MKKILYKLFIFAALLSSCTDSSRFFDDEQDRVNMAISLYRPDTFEEDRIIDQTFLYSDYQTDTIWINVISLGHIREYDRTISLRQMQIGKDTVNNAVAGVHYIDFADVDVPDAYTIKAGEPLVEVPIILKRHPDMIDTTFTLCVELVANETFEVGNNNSIVINTSELLVKPKYWYAVLTPENTKVAYSTAKHNYMNECVLNEFGFVFNDEYILNRDIPQSQKRYYVDFCRLELEAEQASRLEQGLAPLYDDDGVTILTIEK